MQIIIVTLKRRRFEIRTCGKRGDLDGKLCTEGNGSRNDFFPSPSVFPLHPPPALSGYLTALAIFHPGHWLHPFFYPRNIVIYHKRLFRWYKIESWMIFLEHNMHPTSYYPVTSEK